MTIIGTTNVIGRSIYKEYGELNEGERRRQRPINRRRFGE